MDGLTLIAGTRIELVYKLARSRAEASRSAKQRKLKTAAGSFSPIGHRSIQQCYQLKTAPSWDGL